MIRKILVYFGLLEPAGQSGQRLPAPSLPVLALAIVLGGVAGFVVNHLGAGGTVGALLGAAIAALVLYVNNWRRASRLSRSARRDET